MPGTPHHPRSPNPSQHPSTPDSYASEGGLSASISQATTTNRRRYPSPLLEYTATFPDQNLHPLSQPDSPDRPPLSLSRPNVLARRLLPTRVMRVSYAHAKTFLNLSIAFNILLLIALFLPTEQAHDLIGEKAWTKAGEYGLLNRWGASEIGGFAGSGAGQAVMSTEKGCRMCEVDPELCEEVGEADMMKSLGYTGTSNRLRRALAKMRRGEPFTIGVIGGSVSKGHGLEDPKGDHAHTARNLNKIVFDHLDQLFPAANGVALKESGKKDGKNSFINGAQGGMGTDYFSLCFNEHIPEDVDIVFIELAINDEVLLRNMNTYELLIRGLADLPNKPAILNFQVFALMFQYIANGGDLHSGVSQYYDVPTISLRNPYLPHIMANTTLIRDLFHNRVQKDSWTDPLEEIDLRHLSWQGHRLMGKLASAYVDTQLCEMDRIEAGLSEAEKNIDTLYPVEPLPRAPLMKQFAANYIMPKLAPQCFSANAVKHPLKPTSQTGWRHWNWKEKHYLVADEPGSKMEFKITTNLGQVQLHYLRSYQYNLGSARCWIDNDKDKAIRLDGYWKEPYNIGRASTIRDDLEPGEHTLHCELLKETADPTGGKEFRIISIMSI